MKNIIKQIHAESMGAGEALVLEASNEIKEANSALLMKPEEVSKIEQADLARKLGFTNAANVEEAKDVENRVKNANKKLALSKETVDCINEWQTKYPTYKFITFDALERIAMKYNLHIAPVGFFYW